MTHSHSHHSLDHLWAKWINPYALLYCWWFNPNFGRWHPQLMFFFLNPPKNPFDNGRFWDHVHWFTELNHIESCFSIVKSVPYFDIIVGKKKLYAKGMAKAVFWGHPTKTGWWFGTCFIFPFHIWDNPNPIDELIFFRGVGSTTNQIMFW